jgi:hypothetical protein
MSREAFEAWIKRDSTLSIGRDGEGYADMDVYIQWRAWQAAQADAYERSAKVCETAEVPIDIDVWMGTKKTLTAATAIGLADAIRALAKEAT